MAKKKSSNNKKTKPAVENLHRATKKPFRPKEKSIKKDLNDDVSSQHNHLQLEDEVPDFPRGGGRSLSREELDEVRAEVDAEFDAGERVLRKKKKDRKVKRMNQSAEDDLGSLFGGGVTGKLPRFANKVTLKNISPGMKLWGVIAEVNEKDVVVSLPGGLRGLARASEAFDPFLDNEVMDNEVKEVDIETNSHSSIYHTGQLVSCIVLQVDDDKKEGVKQKIWLSLRLALLHKSLTLDVIQEGMVLSACVRSIEDHGYILHFGSPSYSGFMPKHKHAESRNSRVYIGQLVQGLVKSVDKTRKVVYLSSDPDVVSKSVTKDLKGISIDLLVPGMMVNATVRSTLENGVMLSFLTYFTGTADMFNLQSIFPNSNWKDDYPQNKKVNARILFVDPSTRAIGLTLNPHLVHNRAPPSLLKTGDIFDQAKVVRVDRGLGLLLEVLSTPVPTPAFVSVFDVADKEVKKLDKNFKEGTLVRVRILGFRHLEGLATGILKTSAFEGSVFTHSDVKPGMLVKAKVIKVDSFGAFVQFPGGVKALCPLRHMSEFEITKPRTKFQIGAELVFRVLGCKSKRITVTHKKTLVKSKLEILSSYADATEGLITHGWITKIEDHGCFVHFYNGIQGFAPRSELGLEPGSDIKAMYHVEQVVKCRVTSAVPMSRRINLSFRMTPTRVSEDDVRLGSIVSGVVERVTPHAIVVKVNAKGYTKGSISPEHLADHHGLADLMKSVLKPGYNFEKLLVLDIEGSNLVLTAKYSLVKSAEELPHDINQVRRHSVVHGYVCNLIETGCFVRFIGRLTGFAPKNKAFDDKRLDLSEVFYVGQSVRSNILDVSAETGRITLSLKQSLTSSTDASFIREYFVLEEKIAELQLSNSGGSDWTWVNEFVLGSLVEGQVHETKDFGVVISFQKHNDIFGFISHHHRGGATLQLGSAIKAAVLDVSKMERLVDLSLKPEFVNRTELDTSNLQTHKKRKRKANKELELNQTVNAQVEIVKENHLVLSLPEYSFTLGYASLNDYNTQKLPPKQFTHGQSVVATIVGLPTPSTGGRVLLLLKSITEIMETSSVKRAKKKSNYSVRSLVQAEITEIRPLELRLKFGSGFLGRVHITEATDDNAVENPFSNLRIGQTLTARIVSRGNKSENNTRSIQWELSIKPSVLSDSDEVDGELRPEDFNYSSGQRVSGYVYKVDDEWVWLSISRDVKAQLYVLDTACEPNELQDFDKRFYIGKALSAYILSVNREKRLLRLVMHPLVGPDTDHCQDGSNSTSDGIVTSRFHEGDLVGGRISKIFPGVGGLLVRIDQHLYGRVHYTELTGTWVPNPLAGYHEGQFVKCKILEVNHSVKGTVHIDLSLHSTLDDMQDKSFPETNKVKDIPSQPVENIEGLHPNMVVQGYVKNVTPKGCFIMLSRKVDAKILLSNLSDSYIENPEKEFPVGKLVTGKVVSVEPLSKRVEVTLKTSSKVSGLKSELNAFDKFSVGDIISGIIRRVQPYGLFVTIDGTSVVGLCHISELSDDQVDRIEAKYKAGDRVTAKILKVDKDRHRVSLGMKTSYIKNDTDQIPSGPVSDDTIEGNSLVAGTALTMMPPSSSKIINSIAESDNDIHLIPVEVESRASVPPLEVSLDDMEDELNAETKNVEHAGDPDKTEERKKKREKKKAKEEREREIRAAEERLLEKDIPRNADEFEKLVRSSPNSSFVWIKYMAFMLSLADIEKARAIAERALKTINIREESEKLNVWVAYFNLENEYGNPPQEAVKKVFERALQYCDPKKVHLALLGMYERTEQQELANELLVKMVKKFKQSCKVWLRRVQFLLKRKDDGLQDVIKRALLSLPRHKHIKFITQTAILEFKSGVPDRGRSMFEGMLREYPKRTDLWSVYLDQEIRQGDVDVIRALFERAISLSLPPKKMKFLFKKYLEYEKALGDEERIESVKKKAMEYVESTLA